MRLGSRDVRILSLLRTTGQQDHQPVAVPAKIEPVSRSPVQPIFLHPAANGFDVRDVAEAQPLDRDRHLGGSLPVKGVEPFRKGRVTVLLLVEQHIEHRTLVTYMLPFLQARSIAGVTDVGFSSDP